MEDTTCSAASSVTASVDTVHLTQDMTVEKCERMYNAQTTKKAFVTSMLNDNPHDMIGSCDSVIDLTDDSMEVESNSEEMMKQESFMSVTNSHDMMESHGDVIDLTENAMEVEKF